MLRLQKYRDPDRVSPPVGEIARKMAVLAGSLIEPRGWLRRARVVAVDPEGLVWLEDGIEFRSRSLARLLRGAAEAVLFVLTIGEALEQRADLLVRQEHLVEGLLLDTAGWVAVDGLVREVRQRLAADARRQGLRLTGRMAPGFGEWSLEQQRALFAAFGDGTLSVRLTEACVMLPRKSVSGLYGLVPTGRPA